MKTETATCPVCNCTNVFVANGRFARHTTPGAQENATWCNGPMAAGMIVQLTPAQDWCVVYRTGGTASFTWQRTLAMTREAADTACRDIEQGGRRAMVFRYSQSVSIGLPSTYAGTAWEITDAKKREAAQLLA